MQHIIKIVCLFFGIVLFAIPVFAGDGGKEFDPEKMIAELEKKLELSREQWEKLKPVLEQRSKELQEIIHESVDKGYMELEEVSEKLEAMSEDAEMKVKEVLSSEEARQLRDYLSKIDKDAIEEAKNRMVAELTALLELSEEQAAKIKPVLEDSMTRLSTLFNELAKEGSKSWETFREKFEQLATDLQNSLRETLDNEQMKRLEEYNEEQKVKIQKALFTV